MNERTGDRPQTTNHCTFLNIGGGNHTHRGCSRDREAFGHALRKHCVHSLKGLWSAWAGDAGSFLAEVVLRKRGLGLRFILEVRSPSLGHRRRIAPVLLPHLVDEPNVGAEAVRLSHNLRIRGVGAVRAGRRFAWGPRPGPWPSLLRLC